MKNARKVEKRPIPKPEKADPNRGEGSGIKIKIREEEKKKFRLWESSPNLMSSPSQPVLN